MLAHFPLAGHFLTAGERKHSYSRWIICVFKLHSTQGFNDYYNAYCRMGFHYSVSYKRGGRVFSYLPLDATFIEASTNSVNTSSTNTITELRNKSHWKSRRNITVNSCVNKDYLLVVLKTFKQAFWWNIESFNSNGINRTYKKLEKSKTLTRKR